MKRLGLIAFLWATGAVGTPALADSFELETSDVVYSESIEWMSGSESLPQTESSLLASDPNDPYREKLVIIINKSDRGSTAQTLRVFWEGQPVPDAQGNLLWKISTGREKKETAKSGKVYVTTTPVGYFRPIWMTKLHRSKTWHSDMPYSIFFFGGIATHGTKKTSTLGKKRDSGGCIRLSIPDAKKLYELTVSAGRGPTEKIHRSGKTVTQADGSPVLERAYRTLIIVEDRI